MKVGRDRITSLPSLAAPAGARRWPPLLLDILLPGTRLRPLEDDDSLLLLLLFGSPVSVRDPPRGAPRYLVWSVVVSLRRRHDTNNHNNNNNTPGPLSLQCQ